MRWAAREPTPPFESPQFREPVRKGMDHRTPISSREAKISWLLSHQLLWVGSEPDNDRNWREIIKLMKVDGLIAHTTYPLDVNVPSLIAEAHLQQVQAGLAQSG